MESVSTAAVTPVPAIKSALAASRVRMDAFDELFADLQSAGPAAPCGPAHKWGWYQKPRMIFRPATNRSSIERSAMFVIACLTSGASTGGCARFEGVSS